ncbi:DUF397 domain-containing protein [Actinomadura macra]|uniref:DUF397 domain-containing protein n=1 Tax=Actinomadura macra TaxID=46164 RepID=UPI00082B1F3A|nr:DUF397 domain-containing protein [Actinomadura macra]
MSTWRKSSHSGPEQGDCVEVAGLPDRTTGIRDSKDPDHGHLALTRRAFSTLVTQAKRGDLGLLHRAKRDELNL